MSIKKRLVSLEADYIEACQVVVFITETGDSNVFSAQELITRGKKHSHRYSEIKAENLQDAAEKYESPKYCSSVTMILDDMDTCVQDLNLFVYTLYEVMSTDDLRELVDAADHFDDILFDKLIREFAVKYRGEVLQKIGFEKCLGDEAEVEAAKVKIKGVNAHG